jgi:hypothetical protein
MAAKLVDRLAVLVAFRRFLGMVLQTLAHCVLTVMSACTISFVDLLMLLFDDFGGSCGENSCNVFLLVFMVPWVPTFATLCMRAMLMLWHAFLFLGLRPMGFYPPFSFLIGGFHCLFL